MRRPDNMLNSGRAASGGPGRRFAGCGSAHRACGSRPTGTSSNRLRDAGSETSGSKTPGCRLKIEGRGIERLTLVDANEQPTQIERPGESVPLPAGRYRVQQVELQGGFRCHEFAASEDAWLQVAPDQSPVLKAGAPLTPRVRVKREARLLTLQYELVDAAGRHYTPDDKDSPPQFSIFKDGRPIDSGSFEYG